MLKIQRGVLIGKLTSLFSLSTQKDKLGTSFQYNKKSPAIEELSLQTFMGQGASNHIKHNPISH
jgi:hypothetical protein